MITSLLHAQRRWACPGEIRCGGHSTRTGCSPTSPRSRAQSLSLERASRRRGGRLTWSRSLASTSSSTMCGTSFPPDPPRKSRGWRPFGSPTLSGAGGSARLRGRTASSLAAETRPIPSRSCRTASPPASAPLATSRGPKCTLPCSSRRRCSARKACAKAPSLSTLSTFRAFTRTRQSTGRTTSSPLLAWKSSRRRHALRAAADATGTVAAVHDNLVRRRHTYCSEAQWRVLNATSS
mmetsp:Transcript_17071/g.52722  ORF Transcript_17071/g.52722 Transcript_17071/m.52722 type:complete len:237 (+) Transcript_17071:2107-2817(+)